MNLYRYHFLGWFIWRFILRIPSLRILLTRLLVPNEDREVSLFGSPLFINRRKEIGYWNAWANSSSNIVFRDESSVLLNLSLLFEPGDTFVDIGANVGLFSSVLSRISRNNHFYAFEANPDTAVRLRKTLGSKPVEVFSLGLSDREVELEFSPGAVSGAFGALAHASAFQRKQKTVMIRTQRLDTLPILGNSLMLKIDVEGHEWPVLKGAEKFFLENRVKVVYLDGFSDSNIPIFLKNAGFSFFDGHSFKPVTENIPGQVLAIHHSRLPISVR